MTMDKLWIDEVLRYSKGYDWYKRLYIGPYINEDKGEEQASCGYSIHWGDLHGDIDDYRRLTKGRRE
jgi:hypothetical protein